MRIYIEMYRYRIIKDIKDESLMSINSSIEMIKNEIISFYGQ